MSNLKPSINPKIYHEMFNFFRNELNSNTFPAIHEVGSQNAARKSYIGFNEKLRFLNLTHCIILTSMAFGKLKCQNTS